MGWIAAIGGAGGAAGAGAAGAGAAGAGAGAAGAGAAGAGAAGAGAAGAGAAGAGAAGAGATSIGKSNMIQSFLQATKAKFKDVGSNVLDQMKDKFVEYDSAGNVDWKKSASKIREQQGGQQIPLDVQRAASLSELSSQKAEDVKARKHVGGGRYNVK